MKRIVLVTTLMIMTAVSAQAAEETFNCPYKHGKKSNTLQMATAATPANIAALVKQGTSGVQK